MNKLYAASILILIFTSVVIFGTGAIYIVNKYGLQSRELLPDRYKTPIGNMCYRIQDRIDCVFKDDNKNVTSCYVCTRER